MTNATGEAMDALRQRLKAHGEPLEVWGVLHEDRYETLNGDGFYAYLRHAFVGEAEARAAAGRPCGPWEAWHVRRYRLGLVEGAPRLLSRAERCEPVSAEALALALAGADDEAIRAALVRVSIERTGTTGGGLR